MNYDVIQNERLISVNVSNAAKMRLKQKTKPLLIEIELYFSCLIKKVCHFREADIIDDYVRVMDGLYIHFSASMTSSCSIDGFNKDNTADFPILNQKPYIPKWFNLDFSGDNWVAEFGYAEQSLSRTHAN
jgi:hypothetical protein